MKKIIVAFAFLFQIGIVPHLHAASLVAGALEPTQWLNNIELVATNAIWLFVLATTSKPLTMNAVT